MAQPPGSTYYAVLGLERNVNGKQIKDAYRRAARQAHPDRGGNAELFHIIAVAYETLSDPDRRADYDRSLGRTASSPASPATRTPGARSPAATRDTDVYQRPAEFVPPFSPQQPPVIPLVLAGRQLHGSARQPGLLSRFGSSAGARYDGERLTARLLEQNFLTGFPAARLVNGLRFDDGARTEAGHALLAGYRIAVIDSLVAPPGNFHWDGKELRHRGRPVGDVRINESVRRVQELFPECNVRGWLILHGTGNNPFEPIIDYPPSLDRSALANVHVANSGTVLRELKKFLADGPQPNVVQLSVLGRLLNATES